MITKDKEAAAMKALQAVIIRGRAMACQKADHGKITHRSRAIAPALAKDVFLGADLCQ